MSYYGKDLDSYLDHVTEPQGYRGHVAPAPVTRDDAEIIRVYLHEEMANRGIAPATAKVSATYLCMFARLHPGLTTLKNADLSKGVAEIRQTMKQNTQRRYIPVLKRFMTWMVENGHNTHIDKKKIDAIAAPGLDPDTKKASKMLTGDEVTAIINAATTTRDRAILSMLYEGALRPIEIVGAVWEDLVFDEFGVQFNTSKKTKKNRYIRLISAAPHLKAWRNHYPGTPEGDAPLFLGLNKPHGPVSQSGVKTVVYTCAKRAGIAKEVNPYLFRHSRVTHLIADETPESVVKMLCWGSLRSNMLHTYAHLSNQDIDRVMLTRAGIKVTKAKEKQGPQPVQCPHCGEIHSAGSKFCVQCGGSLTRDAAATKQTAIDEIMADPQMLRALADEIEKRAKRSI